MLHLITWPVLMTNRLLLGIAGSWWGGNILFMPAAASLLDLASGFSHREAKAMQKARERAARHQRSLATLQRASFADFPKSWSNQAPARTLRPGFLEERHRERAKRKWETKTHQDASSWSQRTSPASQSSASNWQDPSQSNSSTSWYTATNWQGWSSQWNDWWHDRWSNTQDDEEASWGQWRSEGKRH